VSILTFPTIRGPQQATLQLVATTRQHVSPFDGSVQSLALPGARWSGSMTWGPIPHTDWRPLQAFLHRLRGRAGRFTYRHPHTWRQATATPGTPRVAGAGQLGADIDTDGWTALSTVCKAGDYIAFNDASGRARMHQVTSDVVSGAGGAATLPLAPPLRTAPPDNALIDVLTPSPVWQLAQDDGGAITWAAQNVMRAGLTLEIVEAIYGAGEVYTGGFELDSSELL
jgi:hypothetical protein